MADFCDCRLTGVKNALGVATAVELERPTRNMAPADFSQAFRTSQDLTLACLEEHTR